MKEQFTGASVAAGQILIQSDSQPGFLRQRDGAVLDNRLGNSICQVIPKGDIAGVKRSPRMPVKEALLTFQERR